MTELNSTRTLVDCEPFTRHAAFTLWRIEANRSDPTKQIKVPVHWDGVTHHDLGDVRKGRPANPAPPLTAEQADGWLTYHRASGFGCSTPRTIGYIGAGFRPAGTGLVCIDADDCITPDGQWTPQALQLMARFPGALIERSVSGNGLHIWFTVTGAGPGKRTKQRTPLGSLEVYSEGQFIACGTVLGGDACVDHTAAVQALVAEFWPEQRKSREDRANSIEWESLSSDEQSRVIAEIRSTFKYLDQSSYAAWQTQANRLKSLGDEVGRELWHELSETHPDYTHDEAESKWWDSSCERTSYQALFLEAGDRGWENPRVRAPLGDAGDVFETTATDATTGVTLGGPLPAGAVLERPANVPDPANTQLSFMAAAQGQITASLARVSAALLSTESGVQLRYDTFKENNYISIGGEPWRKITDVDEIDLRIRFEQKGFKPVSEEAMSAALRYVCAQNRVDSAQQWVDGLTWDGVPRIDTMFPVFYGTADTPYTRACGAYLFTALAGRTLAPGCQADMVVILVGVQGASKTTSVEVLSPDAANFGEVDLSKKDADVVRALHGKQVMELAELQGLSGRALEATKAWVRRREERWTPKFSNEERTYLRRAVVIGTTNENEFLDDPTGERRWLPVTVGIVNSAGLREIRDQLWAEGAARYRANGIEWQAAEELAKPEHGKHKVHDDWIERIQHWLNTPPPPHPTEGITNVLRGSVPLILSDVVTGALNMAIDRIEPKTSKRVSKIMRSLGYGTTTVRIDGEPLRRWVLLR